MKSSIRTVADSLLAHVASRFIKTRANTTPSPSLSLCELDAECAGPLLTRLQYDEAIRVVEAVRRTLPPHPHQTSC